jgi:exodeoxyribonuclease VII large subunit
MRHRLAARRMALDGPARRLAWRFGQPLGQRASLAAAREALQRALPAALDRAAARVAALAQNLAHLNPQAVLERGYAIVATARGAIVHDAAEVAPGDEVALTFARGGAGARITRRDS